MLCCVGGGWRSEDFVVVGTSGTLRAIVSRAREAEFKSANE